LLLISIIVLVLSIAVLTLIVDFEISVFIAFGIAILLFYFMKNRAIRRSRLGLSKTEITLSSTTIDFKEIELYKTHRVRGAGLKIKLRSGQTVRLSSNDNLCDSIGFVEFVIDFEERVNDWPEIRKVKSFGETKFGLWFAITSTVLLAAAVMWRFVIGSDIYTALLPTILVALLTFWSGIEIRKYYSKKS
jgi:hypothetical protein